MVAAGRTEPYTSRAQWPRDASYKGDIHDPVATLGTVAGKALLKYVETKAVVGGVTAIQGSAKTAHPYEGWLVRNVENETFRTKKRTVFQSVRTLATADDFAGARKHLQDGQAFIYHLSEGTDPKLVREFERPAHARLPRAPTSARSTARPWTSPSTASGSPTAAA